MSSTAIRAAGASHAGHLREENEDVWLTDEALCLFGVFDGMGGHMAGDVAARTARDIVASEVQERAREPAAIVLRDALALASRTIYEQASGRRDRHGMGTTAVVVRIAGSECTVAHVGDSRAYLLRGSRLQQITKDHTVVAAMLAAGALTPEEALHHPYKNVLSRCLGNKADVDVDVQSLTLEPGDRLVLCSDGLSGYASNEAIEQLLGGAESCEAASSDLIELALRGGGGDNVTVVSLFAGQAKVPQATLILRESGAHEWWRRRPLFMAEADRLGLARSPICANLPPQEAVDVIAGNLCEAIYHDLEQTSGIHAWTYAENLATGWLGRGGDFACLRELLDHLGAAARAVVADIEAANPSFSAVLALEVTRALIVMESAVGGVLAHRIRELESAVVQTHEESFRLRATTEQRTVPYLGGPRSDPPVESVLSCLAVARVAADGESASDAALVAVRRIVARAHELASAAAGGSEILDAARDLHDRHDEGSSSLYEALDEARKLHLRVTRATSADAADRADAMRRLSRAYQGLAHGLCVLVVDAGRPITDGLREMVEHTARMREQVRRGEMRVADLETRLAGLELAERS